MLGKVIDDSDIVEQLLIEYTSQVDHGRKRRLRCGFCIRSFKYQIVLNQHVESVHLTDLKKLTERERMDLIDCFLNDDSDITYQKFHQRYISSLFQRNTSYKS